jgi:hypothetical protein
MAGFKEWLWRAGKWLALAFAVAAAWSISFWNAARRGRREGAADERHDNALDRIESLKGNEEHRKELLR